MSSLLWWNDWMYICSYGSKWVGHTIISLGHIHSCRYRMLYLLVLFFTCFFEENVLDMSTLIADRDSSDGIATRYGLDRPGRGEIFRTRPDRPWGSPSFLYNGCWVSFTLVKWPWRGIAHPPLCSAEVSDGRYIAIHLRPSGP